MSWYKRLSFYTVKYWYGFWTILFYIIMTGCFIYSGWSLLQRVFYWLKNAEWLSKPFSLILPNQVVSDIYNTNYEGMKKILLFLIGLDISIIFIILGFLSLITAFAMEEKIPYEDYEDIISRDEERRKEQYEKDIHEM